MLFKDIDKIAEVIKTAFIANLCHVFRPFKQHFTSNLYSVRKQILKRCLTCYLLKSSAEVAWTHSAGLSHFFKCNLHSVTFVLIGHLTLLNVLQARVHLRTYTP